MSAFIASSNVNGGANGFAFGMMNPPMANKVIHSPADTSSEHVSAAACSASCYHFHQDALVLPIVMRERKLCQHRGMQRGRLLCW